MAAHKYTNPPLLWFERAIINSLHGLRELVYNSFRKHARV